MAEDQDTDLFGECKRLAGLFLPRPDLQVLADLHRAPPSTKALAGAQGLAVSLEPTAGSPTGPVLYQGPLLSL